MGDEELDFAEVTVVTVSTTHRCVTVQVAAMGDAGNNNTSERGDDVEVLQPMGLMASPAITARTEAPFVRIGDRQVALGLIDKSAPVQAVESGETRMYGVNGSTNNTTVVRIRADGSIEITSKAAMDIVLNGGTLKVARVTDPVTVNLTALQIAAIIAPPGGGPCSGGPIAITGTIDSGGGATRVKA